MAEGKARTTRSAITSAIFKHGAEPATSPPSGWSEMYLDNSGNLALKRFDGSSGGILNGSNLFDAGQLNPTTLHGSLAISLQKLSVAAQGITTDKMADLNVTLEKLASQSVNDSKIVTAGIAAIALLAVGEAHIQDAAITNAKIASMNVSKLLAGTATFSGNITMQNSGGSFFLTAGGASVFSDSAAVVLASGSASVRISSALFVDNAGGWLVAGGSNPTMGPSGGSNHKITSAVFDATSEYRKSGSALALADLAGNLSASNISGGSLPSNVFGNGIATTQGIGAAGFNINGGDTGKSGSFTTADGKTATFTGGVLTALV